MRAEKTILFSFAAWLNRDYGNRERARLLLTMRHLRHTTNICVLNNSMVSARQWPISSSVQSGRLIIIITILWISHFAEYCDIKMLKNICILWSNAGTCPNDGRKMVWPSQQRMNMSVLLHIITALANTRDKNEENALMLLLDDGVPCAVSSVPCAVSSAQRARSSCGRSHYYYKCCNMSVSETQTEEWGLWA